jgi:hypothetical protein
MWFRHFKAVQGLKVPMKVGYKRDGKAFVESKMADVKPRREAAG